MNRNARSALFAVLLASLCSAFLLSGCVAGEDDPDIIGPLQSTGLALSSSGTGSAGLPLSVEGSRTQVWTVSNDWTDSDSAAGLAWPANSGLS